MNNSDKKGKCRSMLVGILATEFIGMRELCREMHLNELPEPN